MMIELTEEVRVYADAPHTGEDVYALGSRMEAIRDGGIWMARGVSGAFDLAVFDSECRRIG